MKTGTHKLSIFALAGLIGLLGLTFILIKPTPAAAFTLIEVCSPPTFPVCCVLPVYHDHPECVDDVPDRPRRGPEWVQPTPAYKPHRKFEVPFVGPKIHFDLVPALEFLAMWDDDNSTVWCSDGHVNDHVMAQGFDADDLTCNNYYDPMWAGTGPNATLPGDAGPITPHHMIAANALYPPHCALSMTAWNAANPSGIAIGWTFPTEDTFTHSGCYGRWDPAAVPGINQDLAALDATHIYMMDSESDMRDDGAAENILPYRLSTIYDAINLGFDVDSFRLNPEKDDYLPVAIARGNYYGTARLQAAAKLGAGDEDEEDGGDIDELYDETEMLLNDVAADDRIFMEMLRSEAMAPLMAKASHVGISKFIHKYMGGHDLAVLERAPDNTGHVTFIRNRGREASLECLKQAFSDHCGLCPDPTNNANFGLNCAPCFAFPAVQAALNACERQLWYTEADVTHPLLGTDNPVFMALMPPVPSGWGIPSDSPGGGGELLNPDFNPVDKLVPIEDAAVETVNDILHAAGDMIVPDADAATLERDIAFGLKPRRLPLATLIVLNRDTDPNGCFSKDIDFRNPSLDGDGMISDAAGNNNGGLDIGDTRGVPWSRGMTAEAPIMPGDGMAENCGGFLTYYDVYYNSTTGQPYVKVRMSAAYPGEVFRVPVLPNGDTIEFGDFNVDGRLDTIVNSGGVESEGINGGLSVVMCAPPPDDTYKYDPENRQPLCSDGALIVDDTAVTAVADTDSTDVFWMTAETFRGYEITKKTALGGAAHAVTGSRYRSLVPSDVCLTSGDAYPADHGDFACFFNQAFGPDGTDEEAVTKYWYYDVELAPTRYQTNPFTGTIADVKTKDFHRLALNLSAFPTGIDSEFFDIQSYDNGAFGIDVLAELLMSYILPGWVGKIQNVPFSTFRYFPNRSFT